MERLENGDFVVSCIEEIQEAKKIARAEGLAWIYVYSQNGYDGYCVADSCNCTGHIHYND